MGERRGGWDTGGAAGKFRLKTGFVIAAAKNDGVFSLRRRIRGDCVNGVTF